MIAINKFNMMIMLKTVQRKKKHKTRYMQVEPISPVSKSPRIIRYVYKKESKKPDTNKSSSFPVFIFVLARL